MDFDQTIEKYHKALSEFHKENPEPVLDMVSLREYVSLANPLGPAVRGRKKVVETAERTSITWTETPLFSRTWSRK